MFGLDMTSGMRVTKTHHGSGEAGDFGMPGGGEDTDQMLAFAEYMRANFGSNLAELIYHDERFSGKQIDEGKTVDDSVFAGAGNHHDHVHIAIRNENPLNQALGSGQIPTATGGFGPGSGPGGSMSPTGTMPNLAAGGSPYGTPGFTGGYGPEDWEAKSRNEQAVRDARQRADDMDRDIGRREEDIRLLKEQRDALAKGETDILGRPVPPDQAKLDALNRQITDAEGDLAVQVRERGDQNTEISDAERKLAEGTKAKAQQQYKEYQIPGASQFTQLGGGLVKGLAEGFGFGDIFGEAPWEWGIVKLLGGLGNWGLGTANAWADQIGQGKTGLTGNTGVPLPGWEQGGSMGLMNLLGGMGFPGMESVIPKPQFVDNLGRPIPESSNVSAAPNVSASPTQGMPNPFGAFGPPPGPVDASINITNNGPKQSDYDTWKGAQNTRTEPILHGGGLPHP